MGCIGAKIIETESIEVNATNHSQTNSEISQSPKKSRIDHTTLKHHIKGAMSLNQQTSGLYEEKPKEWLNIDKKLNSFEHMKECSDISINELKISLDDLNNLWNAMDNDPEIESPLSLVLSYNDTMYAL